jgi:exopolyphosphatase/guanosine-5'-triphosphate,3'-diphosphate pyrophosphatase
MRLGVIDLGTNSVRFDVHELGPDNQIYILHRERLMIRLGEDVFLKGRLNRRSAEACVEAFNSFAKTLKDFRARRVVAFATSALREAHDSDKLIRRIQRESGIRIRIISGDEEARLIARGILENEVGLKGSYALVDIGGGSTEVTVCQNRKTINSASFALGTARLQQVFLKSIPPVETPNGRPSSIEALRRHIRGVLLYKIVAEDWSKTSRILGSSGTVRAIAKVIKRKTGKDFIHRKDLAELVEDLSTMNRKEISAIPGMEARRVDLFLSGAILLQECMHALHAERVEATEFSLRDGILDEQLEFLRQNKATLAYDPLDDLFETAKDLGSSEKELQQILKIADDLFERLKGIHKIDKSYKIYLLAASLLHGTGRSISPIGLAEHSAYVARWADIPAFEDWESRLISELCKAHQNGKIEKKEAPFKKDKNLQKIFFKLLALLRIIAALSYQRTSGLTIARARVDRKIVHLGISRRNFSDISVLRADQKKNLFEDVFKKQLVFEQI